MLSIRDLPPHHFCVTVSLLGFYIQALTRFVFPFFLVEVLAPGRDWLYRVLLS